MRLVLLLVVLAGCPDRRIDRSDHGVALPVVGEARATIHVEGARRHITLDADGIVWLGVSRTTPAELARPGDPTFIEAPCTYVEPSCTPFDSFDELGRLVAGQRGRQYGSRRIVGEVQYASAMQQETLVFASRDAEARMLVNVVHATGGAIMVGSHGVALGIDFTEGASTQPARTVVPIRLGPTTDVLRAMEAVPHTLPCGERELIFPVHLLVVEGVTVQQLVDAIVALDLAGVRMVGLGNA